MTPDGPRAGGRWRIFRDASVSLPVAVVLVVATLLVLLGLLLLPVNLGAIPFSPDGQLGLLMVIMAIQMMALGETPVGQYTRSWLMVLIGAVFAALGVVSCIVPGVLTDLLRVLLGLLNIVGGGVLLAGRFLPVLRGGGDMTAGPIPPALKKLLVTQTVLNLVAIAFGISMLVPGLVSGMVIAGVVVVNGLLLFALAGILMGIE
ncbi:hypothetical protein [Methanofollis ethanolicus]|uniref:hypothetical protein n=1 Tax=Methanofollis ethanolicus TaxID=488124 RepID=UPI00082E4370|nr:hypothetical protein [Methanofollis ethanolicus]